MSTIICPRCECHIHVEEPPIKKARVVNLTTRQLAVADLVIQGRTSPEIAEMLGISVQVVKNYLRMVYDLAGAENRVMLASLVLTGEVSLIAQ